MSERELTPLALAALSIFAERPRHAYDVYQTMLTRREDRNVKLRPGSLYHAINRMVAGGLLAEVGTDRDGGRPERTTYKITPAGRERLAAQLRTMISTPVYEYPAFPVAVGELHNLPADEAVALLRARVGVLEAELDYHDAGDAWMRRAGLPERLWLDNHYIRVMHTAERDWCAALADRIAAGELDWTDRTPSGLAASCDYERAATPLHPDVPPRLANPEPAHQTEARN
ncbi:PadR family transcriptional regulator [Naumannella huperziae]